MEAIIGFLIVVFIIWLIRAASRQSDDARAFRFSEIEPDPTGTPVPYERRFVVFRIAISTGQADRK